jgi:hypothetical protein
MERLTVMMNNSPDSAEILINSMPIPVFREKEGSISGVNVPAEEILRDIRKLDDWEKALQEIFASSWCCDIGQEKFYIPELSESFRRKQQLLMKVGSLAGGIAHNFNNPLNTISGQIQLMLFRDPERTDYTRIDEFSEKLARMIRNFGERSQRIVEEENGIGNTWLMVIDKEIDFYRGHMDFKHFVEVDLDVDAAKGCPLNYTDASWLINKMLEFLIQVVTTSNTWQLKVSLLNGWPCFELLGNMQGSLTAGIAGIAMMNQMSLIKDNDHEVSWKADKNSARIWLEPSVKAD